MYLSIGDRNSSQDRRNTEGSKLRTQISFLIFVWYLDDK